MATRLKMTDLERSIMVRVFLSRDGFERVEDLLDAVGVDRNRFVDALESLEGEGYLSIANLGGSVVVALEDPMSKLSQEGVNPPLVYSEKVGQC